MKNCILIIGCWLIACTVGFSQIVLPADVVGVWKVLGGKVTTPPAKTKDEEELIEMFKYQFLHSVFVFYANNNFDFTIGIDDMSIKKGHWKYNTVKQQYEIQEWSEKDKNISFLMTLNIVREADKTYIIIPNDGDISVDFSIKLEVVKSPV